MPNDIAQNPTIIGHEFCGTIIEVGDKWKDEFKPGAKLFNTAPISTIRASLDAPGYSYKYCGGDSTYCIIPHEAMETGSLLKFDSDTYFYGSLAEPMSCIAGSLSMHPIT